MKSIARLLFLFLQLVSIAGFPQKAVKVQVVEIGTETPVDGVAIFDTKGSFLGLTNQDGKAQIVLKQFPVLLQKAGFATRYVYSVKALQPYRMQKMGGQIPTITIRGGTKNEDSLLLLRDKNLSFFYQKDTTLYFRFTYSLSLPEMDWGESAQGYIAVNFKAVGAAPSSFNPYRYAYFVQFDYKNDDTEKILPPSKTMPVVLMFANDFMSGYGYPLWQKLSHSYLEANQRDWYLDKDKDGKSVFSAYSRDTSGKLMEEIVFDANNHLQKVSLFTPEEIQSVGSIRVFNNFSKNNGINSFRTVYTYTQTDSNRLLASINHMSTFFDKGRTYYQMKFSAKLVAQKPDETCKIPVYYLAYNHEHPEQNGYGIWLLLRDGYRMKQDHWLAVQDRAQRRILKEIQKMKRQQEQEEQSDSSRNAAQK